QYIYLLILMGCSGLLTAQNNAIVYKIDALRCEHLDRPLGIDEPNPRLSWQIKSDRAGIKQKAYQLIVGTDSMQVASGHGDNWESEKISGSKMLVKYSGSPLVGHTKYFWRVTAWDNNDAISSSSVESFETGMMDKGWKGSWISDAHDINYLPAPYFRKEIRLAKKVKVARAYIAAAGLYELSLNGAKVGNHQLDPMYTRFDRRTLYVTHDVTNMLNEGENAIGVILGNGWYNHQPLAVWDFHNAPWRNRPTFCIDLEVEYVDGTKETFVSERDWKTSSGGIVYNNIYTGEHFDANQQQSGWDIAGFDDSSWDEVRYRSVPSANIVSQQLVPIRLNKAYKPIAVTKIDSKTWLFDFGQNMAGITKLNVAGEKGITLTIKHGERLDTAGRLDLSNIDVYYRGDKQKEPFQTDVVILSDREDVEFMPKFNYKGFRYVEITSSDDIELSEENLTAFFMHSDVRSIGSVNTSSSLVNSLWKVTNNAYLSNLYGYPTDCPQREKNGWTGDGHLAIESALYNFDGITVYEKWLADHRDEQQPNGVLPDIIPTGGWGYGTANGLDWTSTIAIIPWEVYQFYGDSRLLEKCYDNIKRYVDYVDRISPSGLTKFGRGDWVPVKTTSNLELTSSVYFYADANILASAAKLFGRDADFEKYNALRNKIRDAINAKFLDKDRGIYAEGSQTELSVPLYWDVVPDEMKEKVASNLNQSVEKSDFHLDVGVLGAKALLNALTENGYEQSAYKVAVQDSYPSWGWWVVNGATTLLENWDLQAKRDISDNHMMFGEIGGWFFKSIGGILPDPQRPGFEHILLKPIFPDELSESEVKFESPYGEIITSWKKKNGNVNLIVHIPANSSATFYPPQNVERIATAELNSGRHEFNLKLR
ncbi:MAG: family 78 glycoside hydrolase catalytic domain, partial [Sphingobacterium sp.]